MYYDVVVMKINNFDVSSSSSKLPIMRMGLAAKSKKLAQNIDKFW